MLVKILGAIDSIAGLILLFGAGNGFPTIILAILGIILIAKSSFGVWKDFGSWTDLICGAIFFIAIIIPIHWIIGVIAGVLMLQKGIFSFL